MLNHILGLVIEPVEKQHRDIRKLQLNVKKLEECTNEALSGFYAESTTNASKKKFLSEIFKVAKQQERFKNGEIGNNPGSLTALRIRSALTQMLLDGAVEVYVLDNDRGLGNGSENDTGSFSREEDEHAASPSTRSTATQAQGFIHTPAGHSPATNPHGGSFLNELPMRNTQQAHPQPVLPEMPAQHHGFVDGGGLPVNGAPSVNPSGNNLGVEMVPSPQDATRRQSVYSEYNNVGNNSLYAPQWQPATSNSDGQAQPLYAGQANPQTQPYVQQVPVSHSAAYVPNNFVDTMPRQGYDPNHGQMFRPGEVAHAPVNSQQGYNYLPNDGRGMPALPGVSEVIESVPRGHM